MVFFLPEFESVDEELLQSVHMGEISRRDADELQARMKSKRIMSLLVLCICAAVFALCAVSALWGQYLGFDFDNNVFLWLGALSVSILLGFYKLNNFFVARTYLMALRNSHPGSVTNKHPLYCMIAIDEQLLEKISARKFTEAEARGLLNIANASRASNKRFRILAVVIIAVTAFVFFYNPMGFMDVGFMPVLLMITFFCSGFSFFLLPFILRNTTRYVSAIRAAYPTLSLKEYGWRRE